MALHNIPKEVLFEQTAKYAAIGAGLGALLSAGISLVTYKDAVRQELKRRKINSRLKENQEKVQKIKKDVIRRLLMNAAGAGLGGAAFGARVGSETKRSRMRAAQRKQKEEDHRAWKADFKEKIKKERDEFDRKRAQQREEWDRKRAQWYDRQSSKGTQQPPPGGESTPRQTQIKDEYSNLLKQSLDRLKAAETSGDTRAIYDAKSSIKAILKSAKGKISYVPDIGHHLLNIIKSNYSK